MSESYLLTMVNSSSVSGEMNRTKRSKANTKNNKVSVSIIPKREQIITNTILGTKIFLTEETRWQRNTVGIKKNVCYICIFLNIN